MSKIRRRYPPNLNFKETDHKFSNIDKFYKISWVRDIIRDKTFKTFYLTFRSEFDTDHYGTIAHLMVEYTDGIHLYVANVFDVSGFGEIINDRFVQLPEKRSFFKRILKHVFN